MKTGDLCERRCGCWDGDRPDAEYSRSGGRRRKIGDSFSDSTDQESFSFHPPHSNLPFLASRSVYPVFHLRSASSSPSSPSGSREGRLALVFSSLLVKLPWSVNNIFLMLDECFDDEVMVFVLCCWVQNIGKAGVFTIDPCVCKLRPFDANFRLHGFLTDLLNHYTL